MEELAGRTAFVSFADSMHQSNKRAHLRGSTDVAAYFASLGCRPCNMAAALLTKPIACKKPNVLA